jgi:hypothetical protein
VLLLREHLIYIYIEDLKQEFACCLLCRQGIHKSYFLLVKYLIRQTTNVVINQLCYNCRYLKNQVLRIQALSQNKEQSVHPCAAM